jgi:hypothetical protein
MYASNTLSDACSDLYHGGAGKRHVWNGHMMAMECGVYESAGAVKLVMLILAAISSD